MLQHLFFSFALLAWGGALAGQIPTIGGIIGGLPDASDPALILKHKRAVESLTTTPGKLRVVENSGVCETTPGIYQASGYGDLTATQSLWFWFFEARTQDPKNAPLVLWFNGGPGSSSMLGLLQENGPCRITNDSQSVTLNPYSWNNEANILYIDQPVGVGFSYGDIKVGTSQQAAADVWTFMQMFFHDHRFSIYRRNKLAIWTESYGGHYGPAFATYFLDQNHAIREMYIQGIELNLQVLGIGNGLTDPLAQYPGYIEYAANNPYHPLVPAAVIAEANAIWSISGGCQSQISECYNNGSDSVCSEAQGFCNDEFAAPLAGNYDVYYVLAENPDPYPPNITAYLNQVAPQIGGEITWEESSIAVYANFYNTGDWMRNSRPDLERVINAGVRTVIYDGDADYILNFFGVEAMVNNLKTKFTSIYAQQQFEPFKVNGQVAGQFKNAGSFSYVRIYGAGHQVPAYKFGNLAYGQAAAQMFTQIMADQPLAST